MKSSTPVRDLTVTAREGLDGSWGKSMGVIAVYMILLVGVSLIPLFGSLLNLVFSAPLVVGMTVYFLATVRKQRNPFGMLFYGFDRFGTSLCTFLLVTLITLAWMLPFIIMIVAAAVFLHPDPTVFPAQAVFALQAVLALSMMLFILIVQMRYGLALYVVADDPDVNARQAVRRSVELMKGNYGRLGMLWLRFVGWQLFGILTLGISFIWLAPYFMASVAVFYDDLTTNG